MGTAAAAKADADSVASAAGTYAIEEDGFGTGRASLMFGGSCRAAGRVSSVGVPFPALVPGPELFFSRISVKGVSLFQTFLIHSGGRCFLYLNSYF